MWLPEYYEHFAGLSELHPNPRYYDHWGGSAAGPSLRDISQQELNTATQYMIDEHGYAAY